jgi:sulfatase maturation enzyme AslB (radical SAM superfamily)
MYIDEQSQEKIERGMFLDTFRELGDKWLKYAKSHDCEICNVRSTCIPCPARRYLEGDANKCAPYLREFANIRRKQNG